MPTLETGGVGGPMTFNARLYASLALASLVAAQPAVGQADAGPTVEFHLAAQSLEDALLAVSRSSGREIIFASDVVAGKRAPRLTGRFSAEEAVRRLLQGSGLTVRNQAGALVVVAGTDPQAQADVVVTGSRIRGAQAYAPVTTLDRRTLRAEGQTDLGEAIRETVPQNFGGGQSPVIGLGAEDFGSDNVTSGSAINLRGLGPDATLTLLNGRRFAYDGIAEGVDVSAIPLAAVDRVEIVADGASAIYGSDAVAGVANVVLRRDFSGLETAARVGAATEGGDTQQQVEAVAGGVWSSGGVVATASYDHNSAIQADQRAFASGLDPSTVLLPRLYHVGAVLSGHQSMGSSVEFDLDLLYSRRVAASTFSATTTADYQQGGISRHTTANSFVASPAVKIALGGTWSGTLSGTFGRDDLDYRTLYYGGGAVTATFHGSYDNQSIGGEASAEGPLATIAGGEVRLAAGIGYRRVSLVGTNITDPAPPTYLRGSRESFYGFGELNVPLVGEANSRGGIDRLSVNLAGRFEHYPRIGDVFTPKAGLLYAPIQALELRGTWGRSFKAPTLYQLFEAEGAYALPASYFGGASYPANAGAIFVYGGNPDLKPQRATTWSVGGVLTPFADQRLRIDASYFSIHYENRIVSPITSSSTSLSDPAVADLVTVNPGAAAVTALVAGLGSPFQDYSGGAYPGDIAAVIDDRNRNVSAERYEGVDVAATWKLPLSAVTTVTLSASGTYLTSDRQLSSGQPTEPLAGHIFEPPHFRGRAGALLTDRGLTASAFLSVAGGVTDDRYAPTVQVAGQKSLDLGLGYAFAAKTGPLHGLSFQLSLLNTFNDLPQQIRNLSGYLTPFDATNYNPVGRFVSVRIAKQW